MPIDSSLLSSMYQPDGRDITAEVEDSLEYDLGYLATCAGGIDKCDPDDVFDCLSHGAVWSPAEKQAFLYAHPDLADRFARF